MLNKTPTKQDYLKAGLGYGLSRRSKDKYATLLQQQEKDTRVILKTQQLIEWAHSSFEKAKHENRRNIKLYTELIFDWNPARVFSTYKHFDKLCQYLSQERVWSRLDRKERAFIADAYNYFLHHSQD